MKTAIWIQALKQMWGIIAMEWRLRGNYPDAESFRGKVAYSLPFRGKWTAVNGGVSPETSHSWEIPTQRYAYDFVILDQGGGSFSGDETDPASFFCYGQDVLAPADGLVAELGRGCPNSGITPDRAASCGGRDIRGNYILLRHAEGEYALLAHLEPDSILVSVGQRVRRGEKLARCGNSGNSSEPHLHFHLQAGRSFYASPGLPIAFADIAAEPAPNYKRFDDRGVPEEYRRFTPPWLTRGQTAWNLEPPGESRGT